MRVELVVKQLRKKLGLEELQQREEQRKRSGEAAEVSLVRRLVLLKLVDIPLSFGSREQRLIEAERRVRISLRTKAAYEDLGARARLSLAMQKAWSNPEYKERQREIQGRVQKGVKRPRK